MIKADMNPKIEVRIQLIIAIPKNNIRIPCNIFPSEKDLKTNQIPTIEE